MRQHSFDVRLREDSPFCVNVDKRQYIKDDVDVLSAMQSNEHRCQNWNYMVFALRARKRNERERKQLECCGKNLYGHETNDDESTTTKIAVR